MFQEMTKERIIPRVTEDHEKMFNDDPVTITDSQLDIGQGCHQGDLIVVRLGAMPTSAKPRNSRQLAEGDTQGSRHILAKGQVFDADPAEVAALIKKANGVVVNPAYIGPVFCTNQNGEANLEHPEHGDHLYRGENMCFGTIYQRNWDAEEAAERRARD